MAMKLPVWFIDYLLYNYRYLCDELSSLDVGQSGFAKVPPHGSRPKSPVERVLVEREDLAVVVEVIGRAWKRLPPELKEVATLKYRRRLPNKTIMNLLAISRSTLDRKIEATRGLVAGYLAQIQEAKMKQFVAKIRPTSEANLLYLQRVQPSPKLEPQPRD